MKTGPLDRSNSIRLDLEPLLRYLFSLSQVSSLLYYSLTIFIVTISKASSPATTVF